MPRSIFITATGTHAGKTWVTEQLLSLLQGLAQDVQALKPIASGRLASGMNEDVALLLAKQPHKTLAAINFQTFQHPVAPALASQLEQQDLDVEQLLDWLINQENMHDLTLIEGVGGLMVPLIANDKQTWLVSDWLQAMLDVDVLLVVPLRLGCMNQALLSCTALANMGKTPKWVVFNDIDSNGTGLATINILKPCLAKIFAAEPMLVCVEQAQDLLEICHDLQLP